jgi:hypothetical protein
MLLLFPSSGSSFLTCSHNPGTFTGAPPLTPLDKRSDGNFENPIESVSIDIVIYPAGHEVPTTGERRSGSIRKQDPGECIPTFCSLAGGKRRFDP